MAIGPIAAAATVGQTLSLQAGGIGPLVVFGAMIGDLGVGHVFSDFAKRISGCGTVYEFTAQSLGPAPAVGSAALYHIGGLFLGSIVVCLFAGVGVTSFCATHLGFSPPWWVGSVVVAAA